MTPVGIFVRGVETFWLAAVNFSLGVLQAFYPDSCSLWETKHSSRTPFGIHLSFQTCQWLQDVSVTFMSHSGLMSNYCRSLNFNVPEA